MRYQRPTRSAAIGPRLKRPPERLGFACLLLATVLLGGTATGCGSTEEAKLSTEPARIRVALLNVKELSAAKLNLDPADAANPDAQQIVAAVAIVARTRPDVLVLQEVDQGSDQDPASVARLFAERLRDAGVDLSHTYSAPSNTGRLTGIDLDQDGVVATTADQGTRKHGNDSFGFGTYPGQYSMAVLSRLPFDTDRARTFQTFLWKDLAGHHIDTGLQQPFLSDQARSLFRLSSKSHWDLPVLTSAAPDAAALRLLISHPTPPVFDGPEDRNGRRNFDEIKFWADYLDSGDNASAITDDSGLRGGFDAHSQTQSFVLAGDLNAFPHQGDNGNALYDGRSAISQLLEHPRVQDAGPWLISPGAPPGQPRATAGFSGGKRIDYLLPSRDLKIVDGGVFWPDPTADPVGAELALQASDHRLVWLELELHSSGDEP